jgi:hypothetical protein
MAVAKRAFEADAKLVALAGKLSVHTAHRLLEGVLHAHHFLHKIGQQAKQKN